MSDPQSIDGVLVQWGEGLFYPGNRIVKVAPQPKLPANLLRQRANLVRARIEATVVRRAPQVMVKVTGGGRGMKAIAAHFKYISKNGRLDIEDDRAEILRGKDDLRGIVDDWRLGGTPIDDLGFRREACNIMLSMPRGIDPLYVLKAAQEFAHAEFGQRQSGWPTGQDDCRAPRVRRPQVRDGSARSPGQSARAPERACRVEAWQTAQSAEGRPQSLEAGLCRESQGLGR